MRKNKLNNEKKNLFYTWFYIRLSIISVRLTKYHRIIYDDCIL